MSPTRISPSHLAAALLAALASGLLAGCPGSGSGGGPASATGGASAGVGAGSGTGAGTGAGVDLLRLEQEMRARKAAYLLDCAVGFGGLGEGRETQLARLETGIGPLERSPLDRALDQMDRRVDTADFGATTILRVLYLYAASPLIPSDLKDRMERSTLGFKYDISDPGPDTMVFGSENHLILFAQCEYLAGHLYETRVFSSTGWTGARHRDRGKRRVLRWLDHRLRFGFSEWCSPVYYEEDLAPLLNLVDFAPDAEVRERAAMALDVLLFDLARLTHRGSFGVTSGRAYEEHKWSGWGQSVGDLVEILFGTRGRFHRRGSFSGTFFATSRGYSVPRALLAIGRDRPARAVDRARVGLAFHEAAREGIGFTSFEDGLFWWGQGAYVAPETIVTTRRMIEAWGRWSDPTFALFAQIRGVPESLLPTASDFLSPLTEGSVLAGANLYTFRTPDAMLSSVLSYRRGQVGYQQHAWQATLDMEACVWTTAPGTLGRDGPGDWTGSGSLPRVIQDEDVLVALYNPGVAQKALFPRRTHAFFPRAAFDEVRDQGAWTFARRGEGYLALYSARPLVWTSSGPFADREAVADGERNVWICEVGRSAEDGPFDDFCARVAAASVVVVGAGSAPQTDRLSVAYEAPGRGRYEIEWSGTPTLNGQPLPTGGFPRWDNPYCQANFGARIYDIRHAGAALHHDVDLGLRTGDGL
jgi:hypothetical protein